MRNIIFTTIVLVLMLQGCGSSATHDSVARDGIAVMKDFTETLKTIKDEETAKSAAPKMKQLGEKMKTLQQQKESLPKISAEEEKKITEKYTADGLGAAMSLMAEAERVNKIPGAKAVLDDAMKDLKLQ
jgi:hypothetical protein